MIYLLHWRLWAIEFQDGLRYILRIFWENIVTGEVSKFQVFDDIEKVLMISYLLVWWQISSYWSVQADIEDEVHDSEVIKRFWD